MRDMKMLDITFMVGGIKNEIRRFCREQSNFEILYQRCVILWR